MFYVGSTGNDYEVPYESTICPLYREKDRQNGMHSTVISKAGNQVLQVHDDLTSLVTTKTKMFPFVNELHK